MIEPPIDLRSLNDFVSRLATLGATYTIKKARPEAVMVLVATAAERWEVEFMTEDWPDIQVERYKSLGPAGDERVLPELWNLLDLPFTAAGGLRQINDVLNHLESANIAYEIFKSDPRGVTVRLFVPGQYWELTFLSDGGVSTERFESSGEILDGSALTSLWQLLGEK